MYEAVFREVSTDRADQKLSAEIGQPHQPYFLQEQVTDEKPIEELEAEIARDEHRYRCFVDREEEILRNISQHGFAAACQRVRLVGEMQGLAERIRRKKMMLAWVRGSMRAILNRAH